MKLNLSPKTPCEQGVFPFWLGDPNGYTGGTVIQLTLICDVVPGSSCVCFVQRPKPIAGSAALRGVSCSK